MSPSLHDTLAELADEITVDDVPTGLAETAWGAADLERRRSLRTRALGGLAATAAAAVAFWLVASGGLPGIDSAPADGSPSGVGLPQRVSFQADPPPLPAKGEPLAALVSVGSRGEPPSDPTSRGTANGGTPWQGLGDDGRLWSIDGPVAPVPPLDEGQELSMPTPPALSPDGHRLALVRSVDQVLHEDETTKESRVVRYQLDIHDLTTGEHEVRRDICGSECHVSALRWSPDGESLALLGHDPDQAVLVTTGVLGGPRASTADLVTLGPNVSLVGWTSDEQVLLVPLTTHLSVTIDGEVRPATVASGDTTVRRLPRLLASENALQDSVDPDLLSLVHGRLAVPEGGDGPGWRTADLSRGGFDSTISVPQLPGLGEPGGSSRVSALPGTTAAVVTRAAAGGPAHVVTSEDDRGPRLLTVMAPDLDVQDIILAADAPAGPVTTDPLGTETAWWSWHPVQATLLALAPFALLGGWLLVRRRHSRG